MSSEQTVILGAGIMGLSAAFYLSEEVEPSNVHVFDPSPTLFECASGNAAGFLAKDWFNSEAMLWLGEISLNEHKRLAHEYNGREIWGYLDGRAISYRESSSFPDSNGDDWLWEGGSRSVVAPSRDGEDANGYIPKWLRPGETEDLSEADGTAQVNPKDLCKFLLKICSERGVHIHNPARVDSVIEGPSGISGIQWSTIGALNAKTDMPCSHVLLAAGAWTPYVFKELFDRPIPKGIPISPLAGWSIVIGLPMPHPDVKLPTSSDAIFASGTKEGFSPEFFTRIQSVPSGSTEQAKREIWLGGLNSHTEPLPDASTSVMPPRIDDDHIQTLLSVAKRYFIGLDSKQAGTDDQREPMVEDSFEPQLIKTALCFRPATKTGRPFIGRVPHHMYQNTVSAPTRTEDREHVEERRGGLFICSGHGPWGIALSLGSGKVISEIMLHGDREKRWESLGLTL